MYKLKKGAESYILDDVILDQIDENEWTWGTPDHFGQIVKELGSGFFKSQEAAHNRMVYELSRNNTHIDKANRLYDESIKFKEAQKK